MTPDEYQKLAGRTECNQVAASDRLSVEGQVPGPLRDLAMARVRLNHAVVGLAGEVGELAGAVEGWVYYGKDLDVKNVKEELGDLCWYIAEACNALGISLSNVMEANILKLQVRYPEKYTDDAAANRDLEAEAKALESLTTEKPSFVSEKYANRSPIGSSSIGAPPSNYYRTLGQRADKGESEPSIEIRAKTRELGMVWQAYQSWEQVGEALDRAIANAAKPKEDGYYKKLGKKCEESGEDADLKEIVAKAENYGIDPDIYEFWEEVGEAIDEAIESQKVRYKPQEEMIDNGHGWREPKMDES